MKRKILRTLLAGVALSMAACGDSPDTGAARSPFDPYQNDNVTVIGATGESTATEERIVVSGPIGEGECVTVSDSLCVPAETDGQWCEREGGPVDIVTVEGEVVEVVCYPPADNGGAPTQVITADTTGAVEVLQNANRTAVTFDAATDGVPIAGDLSVDGNGVSVYGNGPDKTVIDGDVTITGNNVRLRGVTITGNLYIGLNNAAVVLCRVLGDVVFADSSANGSVLVENDVLGDFTAGSNGNTVTGNDVAGAWTVTGHNNICDSNSAFADANSNQLLDEGERGDALACE